MSVAVPSEARQTLPHLLARRELFPWGPRRAVLDVLAESREPLTVAEIHQRLRGTRAHVVSVYRTVHLLVRLRLVRPTDAVRPSDATRAAVATSSGRSSPGNAPIILICQGCGRIEDLDGCWLADAVLTRLTRYVRRTRRFEAQRARGAPLRPLPAVRAMMSARASTCRPIATRSPRAGARHGKSAVSSACSWPSSWRAPCPRFTITTVSASTTRSVRSSGSRCRDLLPRSHRCRPWPPWRGSLIPSPYSSSADPLEPASRRSILARPRSGRSPLFSRTDRECRLRDPCGSRRQPPLMNRERRHARVGDGVPGPWSGLVASPA